MKSIVIGVALTLQAVGAQAAPIDEPRPLLPELSIDVTVAGQKAEQPWRDFLGRLVAYFDRDGDGNWNADEAARMIPLPLADRATLVIDFAALDANGDQLATPTELGDYVRQRGFTPLVVEHAKSSEQDQRLTTLFRSAFAQRESGGAEPLQAFRRFDLNDDEVWELDEFLAFEAPEASSAVPADEGNVGTSSVLQVDLGENGTQSSVTASTPWEVRRAAPERYLLVHDDGHRNVAFDVTRSPPDMQSSRDFLLAQLQSVLGQREAINLKEIAATPALFGLQALARYADRNADQSLSIEEFNTYCDLVIQGVACQVWVRVADHGQNPFAMLDVDSSGALSVAELSKFGQANRGALDPSVASPLYYSITFGGPQAKSWGGLPIPRATRRRVESTQADQEPPAWFAALDRNRDGYVTSRESLIPKERFRALDADADGLLSVEEARQGDQAK